MPKENEKKISDLTVDEFKTLLADSVSLRLDDGAIGALPVGDFQKVLLDAFEAEGAVLAKRDKEISERIFRDANGIMSVSTPFRVRNVEDLKKLYMMMYNALQVSTGPGRKAELTVAMAMVDPISFSNGDTVPYGPLPPDPSEVK